MAKHCQKHDITGDECWCCEEAELNSQEGARDRAYSDPDFLARRGGKGMHAQVAMSSAMQKISKLSPEHLDNLIALASGGPLPDGRGRVVIVPAER